MFFDFVAQIQCSVTREMQAMANTYIYTEGRIFLSLLASAVAPWAILRRTIIADLCLAFVSYPKQPVDHAR